MTASTREVLLSNGGNITVTINADMFALGDAERSFVFAIIDLVNAATSPESVPSPVSPSVPPPTPTRHICETCGDEFKAAIFLEAHIARDHAAVLAEDDPMISCTVDGCGRRFRTVQGLRSHMGRSHPEVGAYIVTTADEEVGDYDPDGIIGVTVIDPETGMTEVYAGRDDADAFVPVENPSMDPPDAGTEHYRCGEPDCTWWTKTTGEGLARLSMHTAYTHNRGSRPAERALIVA